MGGAFSLQKLSGNQYELTLKVLRDCLNGQAAFDDPATVGIFDKVTHQEMATFQLTLTSESRLELDAANCENAVPNQCTEMGIYKRTITLNPLMYNNTSGYYFSYQRCCRNGIITNILRPGDAGIAIYAEIPSPRQLVNSTPTFSATPNIFLCTGSETLYNFNFTDADGDQLRYSLVTPINGNLDRNNPMSNSPSEGPYSNVIWANGFSDSRQINGIPDLTIDPITGEIKVAPIATGIYVIAIKVDELRNGIKIGEVRLELQLTVINCPQPIPQIVFRDLDGKIVSNNFTIQIPEKLCFNIEATDATDSLFMTVYTTSSDSPNKFTPDYSRSVNGFRKVTSQLCWQTECELSGLTTQKFKVEVKDNGCPMPNRTSATFTITLKPMPLVNATDILCMTLIDNKETIFYWGDSTGNNPYFQKYIIYRSEGTNTYLPYDSIENKNLREYRDKATPNYSNVNYSYFMRAKNKCGFEGPSSDTLGTFDQLKYIPDQQQIIVATVHEKDKVKITWPQSNEKDFARYFIYKATKESTAFDLIKTTTDVKDTVYIDADVDVNNQSYCYHVVMKDTCDNIGPMGTVACNIVLSGNSKPFLHNLLWNPYKYWQEGVEQYEIVVKGDKSPANYITGYASGADSTYKDDALDMRSGIFTYYVVAKNKKQLNIPSGSHNNSPFMDLESFSNEIELLQKPYLHVPNAFTPNEDNTNETWNIRDLFVKEFHVWVYDKWGKLIYESRNKDEKWDGNSVEGKALPADVYVYRIWYSGYNEESQELKGNVTILR